MGFFRLSLVLGLSLLWIACDRPAGGDRANVTIQTPTRANLASKIEAFATLPSNKRICFAVNVTGSGISSSSVDCGPTQGIVSGFVADGEAITLSLEKGSGRTFELFTYLAEPGATCPEWNSGFNSAKDNFKKTFSSGKTSNVTIQDLEQDVVINLDFPGETSSVAAVIGGSCNIPVRGAPSLKGLLYNSGELVDVKNPDTILSISLAYITSFFELVLGQYDSTGIGFATSTSGMNIGGGLQAAPYLRSFTIKPDSREIYALDESGQIQKINSTTGLPESSFTCPFKNSTCTVPAWVQSISAGYDDSLFALDHAGQLYSVTASGLETLSVTVLPSVTQVSYY